MFELLKAGGPFMYATLTVSLLSLAIFIWRIMVLWGPRAARPALLHKVQEYLQGNDVTKALRLVANDDSPLGRVMKAALMRANRSEREIRRAVEGVALEEVPKVRGATVFLPQLSNLATLLGLIGTIHGLIIAFQGAGSENAATRQAVLSKGISIAFYNTFFGLVVATISVVFYLILLARTNAALALIEKSSSTVVDSILWYRDGSA